MSKWRVFVLGAVFAVIAGFARAGELVVTDTTLKYIPVGTVIDGTQELDIAAGHKMSLISSTGKVINIKGPFKGVPDPTPGKKNDDVVEKLSILVSGQRSENTRLGAIREGDAAKRTDPYLIDVSLGGTQCVVAGKPVTMWLSGGKLDKLWMERLGSDDATVVRWPEGETTQPWPAAMPVADGAEYSLLLQPAKKEAKLTLRVLPADVGDNVAMMALAMGDKGCKEQANAALPKTQ